MQSVSQDPKDTPMPVAKKQPRPRRRQTVGRVDDRRAEIIAATIRVIGQQGMSGATMRAIAREMGLTTGVISHYFHDKSELLHEALQTCFDPWTTTLEQGKSLPGSFERLRHLFVSTIPAYSGRRNSRRVWLGLLMHIDHEAKLWEVYKNRYGAIREQVYALFRDAQRVGTIRAGLDAVVECDRLFALCDGLMISVIGEPGRFTEKLVTQILMTQLDSLSAKAPA